MDSTLYREMRDKIHNFSRDHIAFFETLIGTDEQVIYLILKELDKASKEHKGLNIMQYRSLLELMLQNLNAFEQALRILLSENNLTLINVIYFIFVFHEGLFSKIRELISTANKDESSWFIQSIYRVINQAISQVKNDSEKYIVVDSSEQESLEVIRDNKGLFDPFDSSNIYKVTMHEDDAVRYIFNLDKPDEYKLKVRDILSQSFNCKDYLFLVFISIFFETVKITDKEDYDYHNFTDVLINFFNIYYENNNSRKINEIYQFCIANLVLLRNNKYSERMFESDSNIQQILVKCLLYKPENYFHKLISEYQKISYQKAWEFGYSYDGTELMGGGMSISGSHFSIDDIPIVDKILVPFFMEYYKDNYNKPNDLLFIKDAVLNDFTINAENPVYLKRAIIPLLVKGLLKTEEIYRAQYEEWLIRVLNIDKGIPSCREIIFSYLVQYQNDITVDNYASVLRLVKEDLKNSIFSTPSSVFSVKIILFLIRNGVEEAKEIMLNLVKNPHYVKYDRWNFYTLSNIEDIRQYEPSFILELIKRLILSKEGIEDKKGWQSEVNINEIRPYLIDIYLSSPEDQQNIMNILDPYVKKSDKSKFDEKLLNTFVSGLSEKNPQKAYEFTLSMIGAHKPHEVFKSYRDGLIDVADKLAKNARDFKDNINKQNELLNFSIHLIELFIDDPDPSLDDKRGLQYHENVRNNIDEGIISTVRGRLCWVIQQLTLTEYSFLKSWEFTKRLLSDDNLYIVKNAMVPFIEVMNRRIHWMSPEIQKEVELFAMDSLDKFGKFKPIAKLLLHVFSVYRNIDEKSAKKLLETIDDQETSFFYIYYAFFREEHFQDKAPFSGEWFRNRLRQIIGNPSIGDLVKQVFWQFAKLIEENIIYIEKITDYILSYRNDIRHDERVINNMNRIVKMILDKDEAKIYLQFAIIIYLHSLTLEENYVDSLLEDKSLKDKHHYMDHYHQSILENLYKISKLDFYSAIGRIIKMCSLSEKVYINYQELVSIFKDEEDKMYLATAMDTIKKLVKINPAFYDVMYALDTRLSE
jgi:hypothetical protein